MKKNLFMSLLCCMVSLFSLTAQTNSFVVLSEDFSKFTAGSESSPDAADISDSETGEIPSKYTQEADWYGYGVYQAGGKAYLGMVPYEDDEEDTGYIETPILDLTGNGGSFTVKFKAKSTYADGDVFFVYWYDLDDESLGGYETIEISNDWEEYSVEFSAVGTATTIIQFFTYYDPVFIDDIQVIGGGGTTDISAPVALAASNISANGFTANWEEVESALSYWVNIYTKEGTALQEILSADFADCQGSGGNDNAWSGISVQVSLPEAYADAGWTFTNTWAGSACLRSGTAKNQGIITTPALAGLNGDATLTFRAAAWNSSSENVQLSLSISGGGSLSQTSVALTKGAFTEYTVAITGGTATSKITFQGGAASNSRFFIDDIAITQGGSQKYPIAGSPFATENTSFTIQGLSANIYYYTVLAEGENGVSAASNEQEVILTGVGLKYIAPQENVYVIGNQLFVRNISADKIKIYNPAGQVVQQKTVSGDNVISLNGLASGLYIVKTNNHNYKIVLP